MDVGDRSREGEIIFFRTGPHDDLVTSHWRKSICKWDLLKKKRNERKYSRAICFCSCVTMLPFSPAASNQGDTVDLRTLRAVRVLRPLKLVSGIPSEFSRQCGARWALSLLAFSFLLESLVSSRASEGLTRRLSKDEATPSRQFARGRERGKSPPSRRKRRGVSGRHSSATIKRCRQTSFPSVPL